MKHTVTSLDHDPGLTRHLEFEFWTNLMREDNSEEHSRLKQNLRRALMEELTEKQRQYALMYYGRRMTMPEIAEELGLNRSTVSRTLRRVRSRLQRVLKYTSPLLLQTEAGGYNGARKIH